MTDQDGGEQQCKHDVATQRFHFYQENGKGMSWWCTNCGAFFLHDEVKLAADHTAALKAEMMAAGLRAANFNFEQEHKARKQAEARATSANTRVLQLQVQLAEAVRERDEARGQDKAHEESMMHHYHLWLETDDKLLAAQSLASRLLATLRACQWANCLHDPACHACPVCGHDRDLQVVHAPDCTAHAAIAAAEEAGL